MTECEEKVPDWSEIEYKITKETGQFFKLKRQSRIGGGDTNQAYQIDGEFTELAGSDDHGLVSFFIKFNQKSMLDMFQAEVAGLHELEKSKAITVPHVVGCGVQAHQSYLILEMLSFTSASKLSAKKLGQQLAAMHKTSSPQFGWYRDNTIGKTKQKNTQMDNWVEFWQEYRLDFQLNLAKQNGASFSLIQKGEKLNACLASFFTSYTPEPSLLHGDLWSGNFAYQEGGEPVIYDPAVYYGDREADIAMTELFGGFSAEFYESYNEVWPLDEGYKIRKTLYNLYHILNHFNLFGGGYAMQAENMIDKLLSDC